MADLVEEGHDEVDPRSQHRAKPPEPLHHVLFRLRHDSHAEEDRQDDEDRDQQNHDVSAAVQENLGQNVVNFHRFHALAANADTMTPLVAPRKLFRKGWFSSVGKHYTRM